MNKKMKKNLEAVLEAIIFEDPEAAKQAFHDYLNAKTKSLLSEKDSDEDDEDMEECEDEDKDEKSSKKKSKKDDEECEDEGDEKDD